MSEGPAEARLADAERCLMAAWPALETAPLSGWLLRGSLGGYGRANSVFTLRFDRGAATADAVAAAERWYAARGLPPLFQVSDAAEPGDLDARLAAAGYAGRERSLTMIGSPADVEAPASAALAVELAAEPPADWLNLYLPTLSAAKAAETPEIFARIPRSRVFAAARQGGRIVSIGLGTRIGAFVAINCMLTAEPARRSGGARAVMLAIRDWAVAEGARHWALHVLADNTPAIALYRSLGLATIGEYHYRVRRGG